MDQSDIGRLWARIRVGNPEDCWDWITSVPKRQWSYPEIYIGGKNLRAHRLVLELRLGRPIAAGMVARHTCDNPRCCNPNHLVEGSHQDNTRDRMDRGRTVAGRSGPWHPVSRLVTRIDIAEPSSCWLWKGSVDTNGYGRLKVFGKSTNAHRLMLEIALERPLEKWEFACHTCDNRLCCNPDHLYAGTLHDNCRDSTERGRLKKGTDHHNARLTEEQVVQIRERYAKGDIRAEDIGKQYGVGKKTIYWIVSGATWAWAGGPITTGLNRSRFIVGENNHLAKLNEEKVRELRERYEAGTVSIGQLARDYGVDWTAIKLALTGRTWKTADGPVTLALTENDSR